MKKKATLLNKQLEAQRAEFNKYYPKARELVEKIISEYYNGARNWDHLPDRQKLLQSLYIIDKEKLQGLEVELILDQDGTSVDDGWLSDMEWSSSQGTVYNTSNFNYPALEVNFPDYSRYYCNIEQLDLLGDPELLKLLFPDLKEWVKQYPYRKINRIIESFNQNRNQEKYNLEGNLKSYQQDLKHYQDCIIEKNKYIMETISKLDNIVVDPYTLDRLKADVLKLTKHSGIEKAYISDAGVLCVVTEMLVNRNPLDNKKGRLKIGRFYIEMFPDQGSIKIYNLDYKFTNSDNTYSHPCIKNYMVCWGDHKYQVQEMLNKANLFTLVDFIVTFLSTYPHNDSNPYIGWETWKLKRVKISPDESQVNIKESYQW